MSGYALWANPTYALSAPLLSLVDGATARRWALSHGDDYELCFTAPLSQEQKINAALTTLGLRCSRIGLATAAPELITRFAGREQHIDATLHGYRHFEEQP